MINLSVRDYELEIAGLNCKRALISFTGSDSKLDNQGGLVTFTGTLVLGCLIGFESIDDRINDRWARGNPITIKIADSSTVPRLPPRGGTLFILDSFYDPNTKKLTIECGDILELLRYREPIGNASKICLGSVASRTLVCNDLLAAAGAPELHEGDSILGSLNAQTPKLLEGSYIDQLGAMAAAAGQIVYVDTAGHIRTKVINPKVTAPIATIAWGKVAGTERVKGERPPCKIVIKGKTTLVERNGDTTTTTTEERGTVAMAGINPKAAPSDASAPIIVKRTIKVETLVRGSKQRIVETTIFEPEGVVFAGDKIFAGSTRLICSEFRSEIYSYEQNSPVMGTSADSRCSQGNQGRLLNVVTEIWQPRGVALREMLASYPEKAKGDRVKLLLAEQHLTTYVYKLGNVVQVTLGTPENDDEPPAEARGDGPQITVRKWRVIGAIVPTEFGYRKIVNGSPTELVEAEREVQTWREPKLREWEYTVSRYQSLVNVAQQTAASIRKQFARSPYLIQLLTLLVSTDFEQTVSNAGQAQPPGADTYPPEFVTTEKTFRAEAKLPANASTPYRQSVKYLSFDYLSSVGAAPQAEAQKLADLWGRLLWGRYKSTAYKTDLADFWWDYSPLDRINVIEPEHEFAYLADGWTIALAGNRCMVGFDGLYLGQWIDRIDNPDDPDNPISLSEPVIVPLYKVVRAAQATGVGGIRVQRRDYDRTPLRRTVQAASVSTARNLGGEEVRKVQVAEACTVKVVNRRRIVKAATASTVQTIKLVAWQNVTPQLWSEMSDRQWRKIY